MRKIGNLAGGADERRLINTLSRVNWEGKMRKRDSSYPRGHCTFPAVNGVSLHQGGSARAILCWLPQTGTGEGTCMNINAASR